MRDKPGPVGEEASGGGGGPDSGSEGRACGVPGGFLSQHLVALFTPTTPSTKGKTGPRASVLASWWQKLSPGLGSGRILCTEPERKQNWRVGRWHGEHEAPRVGCLSAWPSTEQPQSIHREQPLSLVKLGVGPNLFVLGPYPDMLRAHTWLCSQGSLLVGPYGMRRLYANPGDAKQMTSQLCSGPRQLHKFVGLVWFGVHTRNSGVTCGSMIRNHSW